MEMKTRDENNDTPDEALGAPPAFVAALQRTPKQALFIPPTVDEAVLRAAREHLVRPEHARFTWFDWRPWLAAAAAAVLLLLVIWLPSAKSARTPGLELSQDLNHDGRVDILDAFILARKLEAGAMEDRRLDLNGDGRVDQADVASLAARAVKLDKGGAL
jgi:hypothetical protein